MNAANNFIRNTKFFVLLILISFTFSCASILNPKRQKIKIQTDDNASVKIDGITPQMKNGKYLIARDALAKQITVSKDGYKDINIAIVQNKKSPYYIMTVVPFTAILFCPPFYDSFIRSRNYVWNINVAGKMTTLPDRNSFSSFIDLDTLGLSSDFFIENSAEDLSYRKYVKGKYKSKSLVNISDLKRDLNLIPFTKNFRDYLITKNYISSNNNKSPKIKISASIDNLEYYHIKSFFTSTYAQQKKFGDFLEIKIGIKWEVIDELTNTKFSFHTDEKSGQYAFYDIDSKNACLQKAFNDALESGLIKILDLNEFKEISKNFSGKYAIVNENKIASQNDTTATITGIDTISFVEKANMFFLVKKKYQEKCSTHDGSMKKDVLLNFIKDVPELYAFVQENFNNKKGFTMNTVKCYNDMLKNKNIIFNQSYIYKFGLVTKKEFRNGPSEEMLKEKLPISVAINHTRVTTTELNLKTGSQTSTTAERYRITFFYGDAEFKKGFLLRNLKKALKDDPEALKHIAKYRANFLGRTGIFCFGLLEVGTFVYWLSSDGIPFGLSNGAFIATTAPGIVFANWFNIYPQEYKTKNITDAVNTYNSNLQKK